jgi:hypothetical protein
MKDKALEAVQFLENVRRNCRIFNKDNLPLLGAETDAISEAIKTLHAFVSSAEIPANNSDPSKTV